MPMPTPTTAAHACCHYPRPCPCPRPLLLPTPTTAAHAHYCYPRPRPRPCPLIYSPRSFGWKKCRQWFWWSQMILGERFSMGRSGRWAKTHTTWANFFRPKSIGKGLWIFRSPITDLPSSRRPTGHRPAIPPHEGTVGGLTPRSVGFRGAGDGRPPVDSTS
jgi:hypothetical protein